MLWACIRYWVRISAVTSAVLTEAFRSVLRFLLLNDAEVDLTRLGHQRFLPNSFKFMSNSTIRRCRLGTDSDFK
jgi:hypothetical protein